jgi:hypothetical protein
MAVTDINPLGGKKFLQIIAWPSVSGDAPVSGLACLRTVALSGIAGSCPKCGFVRRNCLN